MLLLPILTVLLFATPANAVIEAPGGVALDLRPNSNALDNGVDPEEYTTTAITTISIPSTSLQTGTTRQLPKVATASKAAIVGVSTTTATTTTPNTFISSTSPKPGIIDLLSGRIADKGAIVEVPTTTAIATTPNTFISSISPKPTYTKMIMFYGKVFSPTTTKTISTDELSAKECIQECFASETCILAYMDTSGTCRFYDYTEGTTITIEETTDKDEEVVGFKVDLDDFDCPLTYKDYIGSIVTRTGNTGYVSLKIIKWEKTENEWTMKM